MAKGLEITVLIIIVLYSIAVLVIGRKAEQFTKQTREDYFLASREFGGIILFMSLFATNISAFAVMGNAGQAYRTGFGGMGFIQGWAFFLTPFLVYYLAGSRIWLVGKVFNTTTPADILRERFHDKISPLLFSIIGLYWLIPYLVLGIVGGGLILQSTAGIPYPIGAAMIIAVSTIYTYWSGMRGTAWTNVLQGLMFLIIAVLAFVFLSSQFGGLASLTQKIAQNKPELLDRTVQQGLNWKMWFSFSLMGALGQTTFPHILVRIYSAKSIKELQRITVPYPFFFLIIFGIPALLGVWGTELIPGLKGVTSDSIVPALFSKFLHPIWLGLGAAMLLAAIQSTLDGQLLTVAHLVSEDILVRHVRSIKPENSVKIARAVLILFAVIAYIISLLKPATITVLAGWAFSGAAVTSVVLLGVLFWPRANRYGATSSLIVGTIILNLFLFKILPSAVSFGFMPGVVSAALTAVVLVIVSLATLPEDPSATKRFFVPFELLKGSHVKKEGKVTSITG